MIPAFNLDSSPPQMGRLLYQTVKKVAGCEDPFKEIKNRSNQLALKLLPRLKQKLESSSDKFLTAVELAIAGNVIDYGVKNSLVIEQEVKKFLNGDFDVHNEYNKPIFAYQEFKHALDEAGIVLYLADNAGETVFDSILIEQIKGLPKIEEIFYAVKDKPIINDAQEEDALACGIDRFARIVSSGCDAPGIILDFCSPEFIEIYKKSDLVISKGQGNFEALSKEDKPIYFLFRVKCPVVARHLECEVGDVILKRGGKHAHI